MCFIFCRFAELSNTFQWNNVHITSTVIFYISFVSLPLLLLSVGVVQYSCCMLISKRKTVWLCGPYVCQSSCVWENKGYRLSWARVMGIFLIPPTSVWRRKECFSSLLYKHVKCHCHVPLKAIRLDTHNPTPPFPSGRTVVTKAALVPGYCPKQKQLHEFQLDWNLK